MTGHPWTHIPPAGDGVGVEVLGDASELVRSGVVSAHSVVLMVLENKVIDVKEDHGEGR